MTTGVKMPLNCPICRPTRRMPSTASGVRRGLLLMAAAMPRSNSALIIGSSRPAFMKTSTLIATVTTPSGIQALLSARLAIT
jgi:hypothetical protein